MLYEIASYFNVDLTEILSGEAPKLRVFQVVKKGKGLEVFRREQYKYHNLAYNFSKKQIEPFTVEVPVTPDDEPLDVYKRQAEKRLISGAGNISEISMDVGFSSVSYFNRIFKKYKGCTPSAYKKVKYAVQ